jgi:hypothetical protein
MNPLLFPIIGNLIDRILPDKQASAEAKLKLFEMSQRGELAELDADVKIATGQMDINKQEAAHPSRFVAGGRPFIIWTGGVSLAWTFVVHPMLMWLWAVLQATGKIDITVPPPPTLDIEVLLGLVASMLGVAGMRSYDKTKHVDTKRID